MPNEIGIKVEGLDELVRTMRKAGEDLTELKDAHTRAAQIVVDAAKATAPNRSGKLAGSIKAAKQAKRARVQVGTGSKGKVPYAGPIHWGWAARNIEAQPFLSDAARATEPEWTKAYLEDVEAILAKVKGTA